MKVKKNEKIPRSMYYISYHIGFILINLHVLSDGAISRRETEYGASIKIKPLVDIYALAVVS